MVPLHDVELDLAGMDGDAHRAPGSIRHLLVHDREVNETLDLADGTIKENITVSGVGVNELPYGTRLVLGQAVLELTKECSPCSRMEEIRAGLRAQLQGRRGAYARVVTPGRVRVGDAVGIQQPELEPSARS
jgi:MOSC domain-containing protein YiiM